LNEEDKRKIIFYEVLKDERFKEIPKILKNPPDLLKLKYEE
jgi:hypothetical protein